ncbi:hypothetical protein LQ327_03055 [Actinomycetospora endophytica]|uniref:Uncharacterized protein n=1 Tax=Actinomycetospora endophytica TaxID=2291215 RepID=A0ABS8P298_9PSEU|nr:hypothetical protein [Actinomycetospora endophytica]MCD2192376.1 hypothetical protein [Actinomycetospora endophytica]
MALRTTSRPQPAAPAWAGGHGEGTGWHPESQRGASASALAESVFPPDADLPFEPDAEAAAFLNAPRRPLGFYVAPFGTPPFGNPPSGGARSVYGGPLGPEPGDGAGHAGRPDWGPAYSAGA